jgi:hypothetical protein
MSAECQTYFDLAAAWHVDVENSVAEPTVPTLMMGPTLWIGNDAEDGADAEDGTGAGDVAASIRRLKQPW